MTPLLYFVPNVSTSPTLEQVQEAGLGHAFDTKPASRSTQSGPSGGLGVLVARDSESMLNLDNIEWRQIPGQTGWVGRRKDVATDPVDLARPKQLDGHLVTLADGNQWLVPVARGFVEQDGEQRYYVAVPKRLHLDEDGKWTDGPVVDAYAPLWALAERWVDYFYRVAEEGETKEDGAKTVEFDFSQVVDGAIQALATNYRIGPVEVDLLGLLTFDQAKEVMDALVDSPTLEKWLAENQKKTPDG